LESDAFLTSGEPHRTLDVSDPDDARLIAALASVDPRREPLPLRPQIPGWPSLQPYRTTGEQGDAQRCVGPRPSP
jgi:hypothetical protein